MKIFTHNFNPSSNSGPNKFTRTLFNQLIKDDKVKISKQEEADVEFCLIQQQVHKVMTMKTGMRTMNKMRMRLI